MIFPLLTGIEAEGKAKIRKSLLKYAIFPSFFLISNGDSGNIVEGEDSKSDPY